MPPKFKSSFFKFESDEAIPEHTEVDTTNGSIDRDRSKYALLEDPYNSEHGGTQIIAWDLDTEEEARLLAEARYQHVRDFMGTDLFRMSVAMPGGAGFSVEPLGKQTS